MSEKRELATEIYLALNGQQYFYQVQGLIEEEYEEFKAKVIDVIEAELPDVKKEDPYTLGLHESEIRAVLLNDFEEFNDDDLLQGFLTSLSSGFSYSGIWEDIHESAHEFLESE